MNGATVIDPGRLIETPSGCGAVHASPSRPRIDDHISMPPRRAVAKYIVRPSTEIDGENSARFELSASTRAGSLQRSSRCARVVIQMSESSLTTVVDRLKYSVVSFAFGVGNASKAAVLTTAPAFCAGPQGSCLEGRVVK